MAERRKTTIYIDSDVLRATKLRAVREDKPDYQVIEDALRRHLGLDLIERIQTRVNMSEEDATRIAVDETRAVRRKRRNSGRR